MQTGCVQSHDMNLNELFHLIYRNKLLISLSAILGMTIAIAAIFFSHPIYEAKIKLAPATAGDIAGLNQGRSWDKSPVKPMTVNYIYPIFYNELLSEAVKEEFFKRFYLPSLGERIKTSHSGTSLYAAFTKNFAVVPNPIGPGERFAKYTVAIRGTDAKQTTIWLQQFTELVKEKTLSILLNDMEQQNQVVMESLQQQINIARNMAKAQRLDRITQLKEKVRLVQLASAKAPFWEDEPAVMNDANNGSAPVSTEMMQAEIESLSARQSDDAFIPNLRALQAKLEFYKTLKVDTSKISVFHQEGAIDIPTAAIFPKKKLMLMVGLVSGVLAGVLFAMLQNVWQQRKKLAQ